MKLEPVWIFASAFAAFIAASFVRGYVSELGKRAVDPSIDAAKKVGRGILMKWNFIDAYLELLVGLWIVVTAYLGAIARPISGEAAFFTAFTVWIGMRGMERGVRKVQSLRLKPLVEDAK